MKERSNGKMIKSLIVITSLIMNSCKPSDSSFVSFEYKVLNPVEEDSFFDGKDSILNRNNLAEECNDEDCCPLVAIKDSATSEYIIRFVAYFSKKEKYFKPNWKMNNDSISVGYIGAVSKEVQENEKLNVYVFTYKFRSVKEIKNFMFCYELRKIEFE